MQEIIFPEIVKELLAIQAGDDSINFKISHDSYTYCHNVFYLYYDSIISDRELVEKWAKILQRANAFCFNEYRVYNAIRRSLSGAIYHINPKTKKNYFTPDQIANYIDQIDVEYQSIIKRITDADSKHVFYVHRKDYDIDKSIRSSLIAITRRKSEAIKQMIFQIDEEKSELSGPQRDVINHINRRNLTIATGGAGTGKTTIIVELIRAHIAAQQTEMVEHCIEETQRKLYILTPTHMAANNIRDRLVKYFSVAELGAIFIGTIFEFGYRITSHPVNSLIIFEEASMYDNILGEILKKNGDNYFDCKYLFIGDPNQLPPPSRNSVFKQIITSFAAWHLKLTHNYRSGDIIIKNSNRIIDLGPSGNVIFDTTSNFKIMAETAMAKLDLAQYYRSESNPDLNPDNVMFITHRNVDVIAINLALRDGYFATKEIEHDGDVVSETRIYKIYYNSKVVGAWEWKVGDRARCRVNMSKIFNGSLCTVRGFSEDNIIVEFKGELVSVSHKKLWPGYCITVHNSQGQEWERVVFCDFSKKPITAELLYVGISRGKKEVFVARLTDAPNASEFAIDLGPDDEYFDEP